MEKTFILFILSFVLVAQQYTIAGINSSQTVNDIPLRKDEVRPQPRTPSLETFTASYDSRTLTINSSYYAGNVQVVITGANGFTYTYYATGTYTEYIDISTLSEGNYSLSITTQSGFIYTGDFEL